MAGLHSTVRSVFCVLWDNAFSQKAVGKRRVEGKDDACHHPSPFLCDHLGGKVHAGHIVATHAAGHFVVANICFGECMVDGLRRAWRDGVQADEHVSVLIIFVHWCAIGIGRDEGERVRLFALICDYKVIGNAYVEGCDRGDNRKFNFGDMYRHRSRRGLLLYHGHQIVARRAGERGAGRWLGRAGAAAAGALHSCAGDQEEGQSQDRDFACQTHKWTWPGSGRIGMRGV